MKWGILGTGNIATKFATGLMALGTRAELVAVGSRDPRKAQAFCARFAGTGMSYTDVLGDPRVEVVYISLPNHEHAAWSIAAARAGKHVLCEKPAAMTLTELETMLDAARAAKTFFMEGFLWRCHPRTAQLRTILRDLGPLQSAHAAFCFDGGRPVKERLAKIEFGGGALMDVGCYPLSWLRWLAGEPLALSATAQLENGVDLSTAGALRFANGLLATFVTSVVSAQPTINRVYAAAGSVDVHEPWRNSPGAPLIVRTAAGERSYCTEDCTKDPGLPIHALEALAVHRALPDHQAPEMSWADSRGQAVTMDALRHCIGVHWIGE